MEKDEVVKKLCDMYTEMTSGWGEEVLTLEGIEEEVDYILGDYADVPDAPPYERKLVIDKDRVYADTLLQLLSTFKSGNPTLFFDAVVRQCVLHSVKHHRGWETIEEEVDNLERG